LGQASFGPAQMAGLDPARTPILKKNQKISKIIFKKM
jgi:hypothetical protein